MSRFLGFAALLGLLTASSLSPLPAAAQTAPAPTTLAQSTRAVRVYFPKESRSFSSDLSYVEGVTRYTSSPSVARYAVQQLIAGPNSQEQRQGLRKAVTLQGSSNCGTDFSLSIRNSVAQLRFCRTVVSAGVGDDARMLSALNTTLKQFPSVQKTVILDQRGNCLGDMSGENRCFIPH